jgi:hypothetical protein
LEHGQELHQTVEHRAFAAVAGHQTLVDAAGQGHGETSAQALDEQRDGLAGMAHDVFGLGVGLGILVQEFDGGHFAPLLGPFNPIGHQHEAAADPHQPGAEQSEGHARPDHHQPFQGQRLRVKQVKEMGITGAPQAATADEARNAREVLADAQGHQDDQGPEEGAGTGTGRAQELGGGEPM